MKRPAICWPFSHVDFCLLEDVSKPIKPVRRIFYGLFVNSVFANPPGNSVNAFIPRGTVIPYFAPVSSNVPWVFRLYSQTLGAKLWILLHKSHHKMYVYWMFLSRFPDHFPSDVTFTFWFWANVIMNILLRIHWTHFLQYFTYPVVVWVRGILPDVVILQAANRRGVDIFNPAFTSSHFKPSEGQ